MRPFAHPARPEEEPLLLIVSPSQANCCLSWLVVMQVRLPFYFIFRHFLLLLLLLLLFYHSFFCHSMIVSFIHYLIT